MSYNRRMEFARCAPDSQKRGAFARGSFAALGIMNHKIRAGLFVAWALLGVPLFVVLFTYAGSSFIGKSQSIVPGLVWLIGAVFAIASGLRGLLSALPAKLLLRVVVGAIYVSAAYPCVLGLSFIAACAYGGCG